MSSYLKLPTIHCARRATSSRGRDSCDIRLPSSEASDVISWIQSQRCISSSTLRRWNVVATIPAVNPRCRSLLNASRSGYSFSFFLLDDAVCPVVLTQHQDPARKPQ
jgi:hypothetical protein